MADTILFVHDDTRFFELALQEYRDALGDYSSFVDLRSETQQQILQRAQQLKDHQARVQ